MKTWTWLALLLTGCTTVNYNRPVPQFLTVDVLNCVKLEKLYKPANLRDLNVIERNSEECGVTYETFRFRKDLVRSFGPRFSVRTEFAVKNPDQNSPIKVTEFNVEHCLVTTEKGAEVINMTCAELEKRLQ